MEGLIKLGIPLIILGLIIVAEFGGIFVPESEAVNALQVQGFKDVKIEDKDVFLLSWRGCSSSDAAKFDAVATNANGQRVNLYVCSGWPFKGSTIRNY